MTRWVFENKTALDDNLGQQPCIIIITIIIIIIISFLLLFIYLFIYFYQLVL